ncbi:MAG TPA: decaprenyl-phosphate phosphoribosyltransferase [Candidatus Kryptonia bacterium]
MSIRRYIRLMRTEQWVKNVFVLVPLIFSKNLFNLPMLTETIVTFVSFCFAASGVYVINDIADRELDRIHPVKRNRPIASGEIPVLNGWAFALLLLLITFSLQTFASIAPSARAAIVLYIILNLFYSFLLKQVVLLDVFVIAIGFIIRITAGGFAIGVKISSWLVMTTLFISIFLGVAKRRGEYVNVTGDESSRKVLAKYDLSLIDQILSISAASVIITYALYTVSERTVRAFGTEALIFTTVFVVYGIFRYLYLIHKSGLGENPTKVLLTDKPTVVNIVFYIISVVTIIYYRQPLIDFIFRYVPIP